MQTLYPGAQSSDVDVLVQALIERGIPVPAEAQQCGSYGQALVAAVEDFQAQHGRTSDGIVGPNTWAALTNADASDDVPPLDVSGLPPLVAQTLQIADALCRKPVVEVPPRSHRGPDVDRFLLGHDGDGDWLLNYFGPGHGAPWCARFAKWCVDEAALQLGLQSPVAGWGDLASSEKWLAAGHARGRVSLTPAAGAAGCILTSGHGHVVLVAKVNADGTLETREGNSGNRCASRTRRPQEFAGFVRFAP
jgi:hypothetical protein